jgi:hypothetical protein
MCRLHKLAIFRPHMKHSSQTLWALCWVMGIIYTVWYINILLKLKLRLKIIHWKALLRDKMYIPNGCVWMIILLIWSIIIVEEVALGCWCPSSYVEWCGVAGGQYQSVYCSINSDIDHQPHTSHPINSDMEHQPHTPHPIHSDIEHQPHTPHPILQYTLWHRPPATHTTPLDIRRWAPTSQCTFFHDNM